MSILYSPSIIPLSEDIYPGGLGLGAVTTVAKLHFIKL